MDLFNVRIPDYTYSLNIKIPLLVSVELVLDDTPDNIEDCH